MLFRECYSRDEMRASIANQKELVYRVMSFNGNHNHATAASNALLANVSACSSFGGDVGPAVRGGGKASFVLGDEEGTEARYIDLTKSYSSGGGRRGLDGVVAIVAMCWTVKCLVMGL